MEAPITLGDLIRKARLQSNIDQATLCIALGYPYNIIAKLESGQRQPSMSLWKRLTELLGGSLELEASNLLLKQGLAEGKDEFIDIEPIDAEAGQRLRGLREIFGYSFDYVAEQLGIKEARLLQLEAGHVEASSTELRQIAKFYSTSYNYLLDGIEGA